MRQPPAWSIDSKKSLRRKGNSTTRATLPISIGFLDPDIASRRNRSALRRVTLQHAGRNEHPMLLRLPPQSIGPGERDQGFWNRTEVDLPCAPGPCMWPPNPSCSQAIIEPHCAKSIVAPSRWVPRFRYLTACSCWRGVLDARMRTCTYTHTHTHTDAHLRSEHTAPNARSDANSRTSPQPRRCTACWSVCSEHPRGHSQGREQPTSRASVLEPRELKKHVQTLHRWCAYYGFHDAFWIFPCITLLHFCRTNSIHHHSTPTLARRRQRALVVASYYG